MISEHTDIESWEEARGKSTTKGQRQYMGKAKLPTANEFSILHDHDTRHVAGGGKRVAGVVKVLGRGNTSVHPQ